MPSDSLALSVYGQTLFIAGKVGLIQKRWSGIGKEMFTDADNFGVTFENVRVHFENRGD